MIVIISTLSLHHLVDFLFSHSQRDFGQVGLKGESLSLNSLNGISNVEWVEGSYVAQRQPLTWYKVSSTFLLKKLWCFAQIHVKVNSFKHGWLLADYFQCSWRKRAIGFRHEHDEQRAGVDQRGKRRALLESVQSIRQLWRMQLRRLVQWEEMPKKLRWSISKMVI